MQSGLAGLGLSFSLALRAYGIDLNAIFIVGTYTEQVGKGKRRRQS
jgi:hypothetical protein